MEERKKEVLRVYNRKTVKGQYPNGLAYSVHLSVKENEEECPLHNNYGLVFPKAWVNEDNVIVPSFVGNLKVAAVKKYSFSSSIFACSSIFLCLLSVP